MPDREWSPDCKQIRKLPRSCPFTIDEYHLSDGSAKPRNKTFLIREHDQYGEYPHIYAKICQVDPDAEREGMRLDSDLEMAHNDAEDHEVIFENSPQPAKRSKNQTKSTYQVIVLSDTGCGTEVPFAHDPPETALEFQQLHTIGKHYHQTSDHPRVWNISTFLEYTLNPGGRIPYLVMTTHCHYDHILGIGKLPPTAHRPGGGSRRGVNAMRSARLPTTVLSSSHDRSFITPYSNLQKHSLSGILLLHAPRYDVGIWADDLSRVVYDYPTGRNTSTSTSPSTPNQPFTSLIKIPTPYTILHTPGHTPDSLSWYDAENQVICVGDSFYLKVTDHSRSFKGEPPMPTMFDLESNLADWWISLHKVLAFVVQKEREIESGEKGCENVNEKWREQWEWEKICERRREEAARVLRESNTAVTSKPSRGAKYEQNEDADFVMISHEDSRPTADEQLVKNHILHSPRHGTSSRPLIYPQSGYNHLLPDQNTVIPSLKVHEAREEHDPHNPWLLIDLDLGVPPPSPLPTTQTTLKPSEPFTSTLTFTPRIRLAAAHTTCQAIAIPAILEVKAFVARILRDDVPKAHVGNGPRGEERWLWDDSLDDTLSEGLQGVGTGKQRRFSVLAPLVVVEEGRRRIPREEWDWKEA